MFAEIKIVQLRLGKSCEKLQKQNPNWYKWNKIIKTSKKSIYETW